MTQHNSYNQGKIYKIINTIDDNIYIGSTYKTLEERFKQHKYTTQTHPTQRVYKHLNGIGWNNAQIILIENFPCENKNELLQRETYYIKRFEPSLNKNIPISDKYLQKQENIKIHVPTYNYYDEYDKYTLNLYELITNIDPLDFKIKCNLKEGKPSTYDIYINVIYEILKHKHIYVKNKFGSRWYTFENNRWERQEDHAKFREDIKTIVLTKMEEAADYFYEKSKYFYDDYDNLNQIYYDKHKHTSWVANIFIRVYENIEIITDDCRDKFKYDLLNNFQQLPQYIASE